MGDPHEIRQYEGRTPLVILVGVPSFGMVSIQWHSHMMQLQQPLNCVLRHLYVQGKEVGDARNEIVETALAYRGALGQLSLWAAIPLFLVLEDMMQYWWHRASHSFSWLYNLHRAHHNARYMSVRLVYRNNVIYYAMMPSLWFAGALIYLGLGWFYAGYLVVKMLVIIGAHSDVAWDAPLYRIRWLSPVMWLVERTISTPATHHAHHGRHANDPAVHYKGNYGNLLFFWDVLFGTARITRAYPTSYGVENLPDATLGQQLLWPIFPENRNPDRAMPGARPSSAA